MEDEKSAITASVELLQDFRFFRGGLHIYAVSDDGWSWLLAWAQLGVSEIRCVPFTGLAWDQLKALQQHSALGKLIQVVAPENLPLPLLSPDSQRSVLVCAHLAGSPPEGERWGLMDFLRQQVLQKEGTDFCLVSLALSRRPLQLLARKSLGDAMQWREIRHRNLGGLTSARLLVGWGGIQGVDSSAVEPGKRRAPIRPLDRFL